MNPKPNPTAPRRWSDDQGTGEAAELGRIFRSVAEPEALPPAVLAKVHARLGSTRRSAGARRMRELLLAGSMLLAGSSLAFAGWGVSEWWTARSKPEASAPKAVPAAPKQPVQRPALGTRPAPSKAELPEPTLTEPETTAATPSSTPSSALNDRRNTERATAESRELDAESQALAEVLVKLRREHDAPGALALLDRLQAQFAHGTLALEAQVARIDALLALGRRTEALALLEHLPFAQIGRGEELRLVRAELRASTDCGRALSDFDTLVRRTLEPALAERALYGRAACELQVGDQAQAEQDLNQYLARFPRGRFAGQVTSQLARTKGTPAQGP